MPIGPGEYDKECTAVREAVKAEGAILIVLKGERGDGFSCQAPLHLTITLPAMLRFMAGTIESDLKKGKI